MEPATYSKNPLLMKNFTVLIMHNLEERELLKKVKGYTDKDHLTEPYKRRYFNKKPKK